MGRWTRRRIGTLGVLVGLSLVLMGCDSDAVSQVLRGALAANQAPPAHESREANATPSRKAADASRSRDADTTRRQRAAAPAPSHSADVAAMERRIADLLNAARRRQGRAALTRRSGISNGAREWACGMAQSGNFRHADLRTAGVYGENIAWGQRSASEVHAAWMDSLGHRNNRMSERWNEYGVGVCKDGDGSLYFTERFR